MEVICIDDEFPSQVLDFYKQFGVVTPVKDKIYHIREYRKNSVDNQTGILLEEIKNPKVPIKHPILGEQWIEPSFNIKRFASLLGDEIKEEKVEQKVDLTNYN